jgi:steroid delta-isomerase-like uncharacterized protein
MNSGTSDAGPERLARQWFEELFNQGDLTVADEILADDMRYHGPPSLSPGETTGPDAIREYVEVYRTAFPDLWYTVESVAVAGDEAYVRWSATGTHESDLFGMDATGESFTIEGIDCFVVDDGEIIEAHARWDTLEMMRELGILPSVGLSG